ncbi:MAG: haloacid dehalogenase type II [Actinophytocola sp.]|uniref:haloacid dehalogenase type II n=1 Tax=Actinophytocola sp. TaxID=1872138 RepID=UPI001329B8B2|nr:haloacid dehalogenase type II [Actinophytocola sp.]MPZ81746.1 haloacid dehalogenase type II [Actinophytocola sp.]
MDGIRVIACDVFGTTVDWYTGVADQVAEILPDLDAGAFASEWRGMYLPSMANVREGRRPWAYLDTLHRESLDELLARHGVDPDEGTRRRLVRAWHRLPAWPDSVDGLAKLGRHHTLATLSNGGFALLTSLVKHAGLPFDCVLSAELARTYKPDPAVYRTAAGLLDVEPNEVLMVAAHRWDLDGARKAGMRTAFLERPAEKGPLRVDGSFASSLAAADRAADVTSDLSVASFTELADVLSRA